MKKNVFYLWYENPISHSGPNIIMGCGMAYNGSKPTEFHSFFNGKLERLWLSGFVDIRGILLYSSKIVISKKVCDFSGGFNSSYSFERLPFF